MIVDSSDLLAFAYAPWGVSASVLLLRLRCAVTFTLQDVPVEALTTVKPYCNEVHAQAQLWLKRDPKASYEAWKKCLPIRGVSVSVRLGKSISPAPVLRALKSPFLFLISPCSLLSARDRWQWEVPQQSRAPPSLFD